ncbi:MAG TPA: GNAT family N-acetyltransferase [Flavobacteriia bacterium]|nr:GNAT family N-acetyltransferase [Flavobacteriia bacterium]
MLIRKAERKDMPEILELIKELAAIKKTESVSISVYDLMRDAFTESPSFYMFVAETEKEIVGFAIFYRSFSFEGKSIFIEDVYVTNSFKKQGIALSLFAKVLDYSMQYDVHKIVWLLLKKYTDLKEIHLRAGAKIVANSTIATIYKNGIENIVSIDLDTNSDFFSIGFIEKNDVEDLISLVEIANPSILVKNKKLKEEILENGFGNNPWFKILTIKIKEKLVGYMLFHDAYATFLGKSFHIDDVFILPEYQGMGIGKMLYFEFFNFAFNAKANKITQVFNYKNEKFKQLTSFFGATFSEDLEIVEITDKALKDFINK